MKKRRMRMCKMKKRTNKKRIKIKMNKERINKGTKNQTIIAVNQEQALKRSVLPIY